MNTPISPDKISPYPIEYHKVGVLHSSQLNDGSITLTQEVVMKMTDKTERTIIIDMNMDMNSFKELQAKGNLEKQIHTTINKMVGLALIYDLGKKVKTIDLANDDNLTVEKIHGTGKNKINHVKLADELRRKHEALAKKHKKKIALLPQDPKEKQDYIHQHPNEIQQLISLKTRIELLPHILKNSITKKEDVEENKQNVPQFHTHVQTKQQEDKAD